MAEIGKWQDAHAILSDLQPGDRAMIRGNYAFFTVSRSLDGDYLNVTRHHNISGRVDRRRSDYRNKRGVVSPSARRWIQEGGK